MLQVIGGFVIGGVFAIGLMLSGMSNPDKVTNFLDVFGEWDPSLAFVMAGAILVAMPFFRYATTHQAFTTDHKPIKLPTSTAFDSKLLLGSALFGIGWGLVGICPAPAFTLLGAGVDQSILFLGAMLTGVLIQGVVQQSYS